MSWMWIIPIMHNYLENRSLHIIPAITLPLLFTFVSFLFTEETKIKSYFSFFSPICFPEILNGISEELHFFPLNLCVCVCVHTFLTDSRQPILDQIAVRKWVHIMIISINVWGHLNCMNIHFFKTYKLTFYFILSRKVRHAHVGTDVHAQ